MHQILTGTIILKPLLNCKNQEANPTINGKLAFFILGNNAVL